MIIPNYTVTCPQCGTSCENEDALLNVTTKGMFIFRCPDCGSRWDEEEQDMVGFQIEHFLDPIEDE